MEISHDDTWEVFLDEFYEIFSVQGLLKKKIFICGSYLEENFWKLEEIRKIINEIKGCLGFFELSFTRTHKQNLVFKFDLLSRISDEILFVLEHDRGGQMVEMGIVIAIPPFLEKSRVFVKENAPITQVLSMGGFLYPFFRLDKNLHTFTSVDDLKLLIDQIYEG